MKKSYKNLTLIIVACCFISILFQAFLTNNQAPAEPISFSAFLNSVDDEKVKEVDIRGSNILGKMKNAKKFVTYNPQYPSLIDRLMSHGVDVNTAPSEDNSTFLHIILSWLPLFIFGAIWFFMMRQVQGGGAKAMSFGKSKAKLSEKSGKVMFTDVAGIDEAKNELSEVVDFLKDPVKFKRLGGKIPRGVLLVGHPGTGKTLLARAIAGEAGVPFFSISGSEFVEMFVGVGASRVRDLFEQGKKSAPCIIFIDEIDAVGRHRGHGIGGGNDEREQTLNQLLVEMDGFEENSGVIIVAATNRPDVLDSALLRPGRFDRQVVVPLPDINGREQILKVHVKNVPLADDINFLTLARGTPGFSGADLANLVNEAALLAARRGRRVVGIEELEEAKDKVMMGAERKSMVMTDEEKKLTAYHEAGHAIIAVHVEGSDPIHKATIIPRGMALGMVMRLPMQDKLSITRQELEANLAVASGGRIAEEIIFGADKVTTGASSDIEQATKIARRMIIECGMSDKLGFLSYGAIENEKNTYFGHSMPNNNSLSQEVKHLIDQEIRNLMDKSYEKAKRILKKYINQLHILAEALLEHETLTGDEIHKIINGVQIDKKKQNKKGKESLKKYKMPSSQNEEKTD